jgi:hypothetical protein
VTALLTAVLGAVVAQAPAAADAARAPGAADEAAARAAWSYFERNTHPRTGLVSSVEGYPSTTLWDLGSTLLATVAARDLGLLDEAAFDARISRALATVGALRLFEGELPNKAYHAATAAMTDYGNRPAPRGIGWSAVDLGRFVAALEVLATRHPAHAEAAARAVSRWRWCGLAAGGELYGAHRQPGGAVARLQEGRLGYEGYAARALARLGLDVSAAARPDRHAAEETILGMTIRRDARDRRRFGAVDALATDPFALDALELGAPAASQAALLASVFEVQKRRWERTGVVTAMGEDHVDREPWFVYGGIWANGKAWHTVDAAGDDVPGLRRALSTKAAFALAALHPGDPYARVLLDAVAPARDARGWYAGVYEDGATNRALTANTNAVVLEAILYARDGALLPAGGGPTPLARAVGAKAAACGAAPRIDRGGGGGAGALAPAGIGPGASPGAPPGAPVGTPLRSAGPRPFRVDGALYGGWRGVDRGLGGVVATIWPWRYGFLRLGAEATPDSPEGTSRLLWGVGWDDWHERTFFLHVDNWGPVRPDDVLSTREAEVNAGYRLPRLCATRRLCASPVASVTAPFKGGPYAMARVNVTIAGDFFVMGGVGRTLPGVLEGPPGTPGWRVVYGVGRWSWKPGSVFLTYYDWGPDSRSGNGILALGVNFAF